MYFDPETYKVVEQLEKDGELEKAWKILHEEWIQHGDIDYYDDKMYFELLEKMHELYERNPSLIRQRVNLVKEVWKKIAYHSYYISETEVEIGLNIAKNAGRQDLVEDLKNFLQQVGKL